MVGRLPPYLGGVTFRLYSGTRRSLPLGGRRGGEGNARMQKPQFPKLSRKVRNRLGKLADFLAVFKLPKDAKFDLLYFGQHAGRHAPQEHNWCGTTACALGWAALSGKFTQMELVSEWSLDNRLSVSAPRFLGFELGEDHFTWLFLPRGYRLNRRPTAKDVAKHIREVLREQST